MLASPKRATPPVWLVGLPGFVNGYGYGDAHGCGDAHGYGDNLYGGAAAVRPGPDRWRAAARRRPDLPGAAAALSRSSVPTFFC